MFCSECVTLSSVT